MDSGRSSARLAKTRDKDMAMFPPDGLKRGNAQVEDEERHSDAEYPVAQRREALCALSRKEVVA
jgi:hypothetical protein